VGGYSIRQFHFGEDKNLLFDLWQSVLQNPIPERMNSMYADNSYGEPLSWLVFHGVELNPVGSVSVFPRQIILDGKTSRIGINCDMVMLKKHRTLGPALMALKNLIKGCAEQGYQFLLAMPNERSQPVFKRVGYQKIGTAYRWSKVLRCGDKLSRLINHQFSRKIIASCVDQVLRCMLFKFWIRLCHVKLWNWGCIEKLISIESLEFSEVFYSSRVLKKNSEFLKWRYSKSLCQGNPSVFTVFCNQDYAEKSPFAVFGFWPFGAPKNGSKKLIEN